jgi:tRNA pseudouridine55 synthase
VVARVRRLADQKRVGHAGTLDPLARGVLPVLLGRATRLADYIQSGRKTYEAVIQLGAATETDDAEGAVIASAPVPGVSVAELEAVLGEFTGEILQTPPKYSALKVDGRRAYALARGGADVALAPRPIIIDALSLLDRTDTTLSLEVTCSKGTYIRALARDIAERLGTVGHLAGLLRTRVGPFTLAEASPLADLSHEGLTEVLLPGSAAVPDAPTYCADADGARRFANGQVLSTENALHADVVWVYDPDGRLIGLGCAEDGLLRPRLAL